MGKTVTEALEDFNAVYENVKNLEKVRKSFRTRARSFPTLLTQMGLVPSLSFLAAKAGKNNIEQILEDPKTVENSDKFGYAFYFTIVMKRIGKIIGNDVLKSFVSKPIETMMEINRYSIYLEKKLIPYLLEIKMLAEALIEGDEE